ncbi:MAG: hypothetical protein IT291_00035 [Deltaproteobacteria bacterium]|nr:hypothetical protein [Deltaproteobacteria bacterium]
MKMRKTELTFGLIIAILLLLSIGSSLISCNRGERNSNTVDSAELEESEETKVKSLTVKVAGAMQQEFAITAEDSASLNGTCNPDMWANFGIQFRSPGYSWLAVTLMTKEAIQTGQTGDIPLDWIDFSYFDEQNNSVTYKGKGTFNISEHIGKASDRRLKGILKGTKLEGQSGAEGKNIDLEAEFDLNYSCGVEK